VTIKELIDTLSKYRDDVEVRFLTLGYSAINSVKVEHNDYAVYIGDARQDRMSPSQHGANKDDSPILKVPKCASCGQELRRVG